jgi:hypothetical protein
MTILDEYGIRQPPEFHTFLRAEYEAGRWCPQRFGTCENMCRDAGTEENPLIARQDDDGDWYMICQRCDNEEASAPQEDTTE